MPRRPVLPRRHKVQVYFDAEEFALVEEFQRIAGTDMSSTVRMLTRIGIDAMRRGPVVWNGEANSLEG